MEQFQPPGVFFHRYQRLEMLFKLITLCEITARQVMSQHDDWVQTEAAAAKMRSCFIEKVCEYDRCRLPHVADARRSTSTLKHTHAHSHTHAACGM